jgi:hypothetical protein
MNHAWPDGSYQSASGHAWFIATPNLGEM